MRARLVVAALLVFTACARRRDEAPVVVDAGAASPRVARLEAGCVSGKKYDCVDLAVALATGKGVAADRTRARALLEKECAEGVIDACMRRDELFPDPSDGGADASDEASCEAGVARACNALGLAYSKTDDPRALAAFRAACDAGLKLACENAAIVAEKTGDHAAARALRERACAAGNAQSCGLLSTMYANGVGGAADANKAADARKRACDLGWKAACSP